MSTADSGAQAAAVVRAATLYIVATPIGNLGDISTRALDVLRAVDVVYAEDTRHSGTLLKHYGVQTTLRSLHEHNESARIKQIAQLLQSGASVALISDAGTPLISDPGFRLVAHCQQQGLAVSPVPGASALIAALSVSGLPTDRFVFLGFAPGRQTARQAYFRRLSRETRTLVFYESRHRIVACLHDMQECFGAGRRATLARELTKKFETVRQATLQELLLWLESAAELQKGEFVIVVEGSSESPQAEAEAELERVLRVLLAELPVSQASSLAAGITACKRKQAYELALRLRER